MTIPIQISQTRRLATGLAVLSLCATATGCGSGSTNTQRPSSGPATTPPAKTHDPTPSAPLAKATATHSAAQKCLDHTSLADVLTCLAASGANIRSDGVLSGCLHGAQSHSVVIDCLRKAVG